MSSEQVSPIKGASPEVPYLDFIDGLKGIAILMVIFFHVSLDVFTSPYYASFPVLVEKLSRGVHLFFIISGFSLLYASGKHWNIYRKPIIAFYIKRLFRIFPLWWLVVTIYFYYGHTFGYRLATYTDLIANLLMYFGFFSDSWAVALVPGAWSLFVEESFYVFFPFWRKKITSLGKSIVAVLICYVVAYVWISFSLYKGYEIKYTYSFPLANYYALMFGILIFYLPKPDHLTKKMKYFLNALSIIGIIAIFFYDLFLGSAALVPFVYSSFFPQTWFGKLTRIKILSHFGSCCYSLYLFHSVIIGLIHPWKFKLFPLLGILNSGKEIQTTVWFFVVATVSLAVCKVTLYLLEKPSIILGRILSKRLLKTA